MIGLIGKYRGKAPLMFLNERGGGVYFEKFRRCGTGYIQSAEYPTYTASREKSVTSDA